MGRIKLYRRKINGISVAVPAVMALQEDWDNFVRANGQSDGDSGFEKLNSDGLPINDKITGWTKHGTEQALGRDGGIGVSNNAIIDAVNNPKEVIPQSGGTTKYIGNDATVVLNQDGKVVTTWANSNIGTRGGK